MTGMLSVFAVAITLNGLNLAVPRVGVVNRYELNVVLGIIANKLMGTIQVSAGLLMLVLLSR